MTRVSDCIVSAIAPAPARGIYGLHLRGGGAAMTREQATERRARVALSFLAQPGDPGLRQGATCPDGERAGSRAALGTYRTVRLC
jgi:hypothetical protein